MAISRISRARWMLVASATGFASCTATAPAVNDPVPERDAARERDKPADAALEAVSGSQDASIETTAAVDVSSDGAALEASDDGTVSIQDVAIETSSDVNLADAIGDRDVSDGPGEEIDADLDGTSDAMADAGELDGRADGEEADAACPPGTLLGRRDESNLKECGRKWAGCPTDGGPSPGASMTVPPSDAGICPPGYARATPMDIWCGRTACFGSSSPVCTQDGCDNLDNTGIVISDGYACCPGICYGAPPARLDRVS